MNTPTAAEALADYLREGFKNGEADGLWPWAKVAEAALKWVDSSVRELSIVELAKEDAWTIGRPQTVFKVVCEWGVTEAGVIIVRGLKSRDEALEMAKARIARKL